MPNPLTECPTTPMTLLLLLRKQPLRVPEIRQGYEAGYLHFTKAAVHGRAVVLLPQEANLLINLLHTLVDFFSTHDYTPVQLPQSWGDTPAKNPRPTGGYRLG